MGDWTLLIRAAHSFYLEFVEVAFEAGKSVASFEYTGMKRASVCMRIWGRIMLFWTECEAGGDGMGAYIQTHLTTGHLTVSGVHLGT